LAKTVDTVAVGDEATVNAALDSYGLLSANVKALLAVEKTLLDDLKAAIDALPPPDTTPPAFLSAAVDGTGLVITLSEEATGTPLAGDFSVNGIAGNPAVSSVTPVSGTSITLTLASGASNGETVTVSYTQNTDAGKQIKDAAGNALATFANATVTNNTGIPKTVTTIGAQTGALTYGTAGSVTFAVATGGITGSVGVSFLWFSNSAGTSATTGPTGATPDTTVTVGGSPTNITLATTNSTMVGTYYFRVIIDGDTSTGVGTLTVAPALENTPTAAINYSTEKLTGLTNGNYTINSSNVTVSDGTYNIASLISTSASVSLSIVKKGNDTTTTDSVAQTNLSLPARPAAPSVSGGAGKITGTTTALEYSATGTSGWTTCSNSATTVAAGYYYVRVQQTGSNFAGVNSAQIQVTEVPPDTRFLTIDAIPTFDAVSYGYAIPPTTKNITIRNSGNAAATISGVVLSGAGASAFDLGGTDITISAGGSLTTRTVQPKAGLAAGTYTATITVTYNGTSGTTATADVSITVNKATGGTVSPPASSGGSATSITVNAVSVSGNSEQSVEYAVSTSNTATPTGGWQTGTTFNSLTPGATYYVYVRAKESTNYLTGTAVHSTAIEVGKLSQAALTFSAGTTATKTYGDTGVSYTVPASGTGSGSGGGAISYAVTSGDAASVNTSSGAVTILKAGTAVITATKAGDATYNAATAILTLTVDKLTLTATAQATNRVYNGSATVTVNITPTNTVGSDAVALTATGTMANADAGNTKTVTISGISEPSGAQGANYNKPASIPSTMVDISKAVGGTVTTPSGSPSGTSITVNAVSVSGNTEQSTEYAISTSNTATPTTGWQTALTFNGLNAGATYYVYARAKENTNYLTGTAAHSTAIEVGRLSQAALTFTTTASVTYGDANPIYTATGGSGGGAISYAVTSGDVVSVNTSSGAVTILKAGQAVITATKAGDATYNSTTATLTLTVNKAAITPVVTLASSTYPTVNSPSVSSGNPGSGSVSYSYSATETGEYSATVPSTAGTYWVKATVAETTNYLGGTSAAVSFAVSYPTGSRTITIGFNYGAISITGNDGSNVISRTASPMSLSFTAVGYDSGTWYIDGTATTTGNNITINAANYDVRNHSVTFVGVKDGNYYSTQPIPFTVGQ
jgi:hypothetical protein